MCSVSVGKGCSRVRSAATAEFQQFSSRFIARVAVNREPVVTSNGPTSEFSGDQDLTQKSFRKATQAVRAEKEVKSAHNSAIGPPGPKHQVHEVQDASPERVTAASWRVHSRLYQYA